MDALLIVGHQPWAKGARNHDTDLYEFDFNLPVVLAVQAGLTLLGVDATVDMYARGGGNVDRWNQMNARLVVEFHCNAFNEQATGTEVLYGTGRANSRKAARHIQSALVTELGLPDRGTKGVKRKGRGGYLLHGITAPCVIPEPFFIDNRNDLQRAEGANLTGAYVEGICNALEAL